MWQKNSVSTISELIAQRPGADFELEDYMLLPAEKLPVISNLSLMSASILNLLVEHNILIVTDYDTDGITAGIIIKKALSFLSLWLSDELGRPASDIRIEVPNRFTDGYGFQTRHAEMISGGVIILLDNGISQHSEIRYARERGNTVFVVDHHLPGDTLPEADLIVNPWAVPGSEFTGYCAAGLAYRLVREMFQLSGIDQETTRSAMEEFVFLAAIGTVGDMVPVLYENRLIVRQGLENVPEIWKHAIHVLLDEEKDTMTVDDIGFSVSPCFNAPGRLGHLDSVMLERLGLASEDDKDGIAHELRDMNTLRREKTAEAVEIVEEIIREDDLDQFPAIILSSDRLFPGVLGIVAGNIAERHRKPVILLAPSESGYLTGSSRTYGRIHLKQMLDAVSHLLIRYGGHAAAAGLTLDESELEHMKRAVFEYLDSHTGASDDLQLYDFELLPEEDWQPLYDEIRSRGPFGQDNPAPVFRCEFNPLPGLTKRIGEGKNHIKIRGRRYDAIGFNMADLYETKIKDERGLCLYGQLSENVYHGESTLQFQLIDFEQTSESVSVPEPPLRKSLQNILNLF